MSSSSSSYPERVWTSGEEDRGRSPGPWRVPAGKSGGWMLAGVIGLGLAAWMVWHFGPDFVRYMKMERM